MQQNFDIYSNKKNILKIAKKFFTIICLTPLQLVYIDSHGCEPSHPSSPLMD